MKMPTDSRLLYMKPALAICFIVVGLLVGGARPEMSNLLKMPYDKLAHFTAYSLITLLLWFSFSGRNNYFAAVSVSVLIAMSDEIYQLFLPGREADPIDFLSDLTAIGLTGLCLYRYQAIRQ
jgi:VanZ family protein